jgi:benzylsuccinate CoA-transferase BbsF subunit
VLPGDPGLAGDPRFASVYGRKQHEGALDRQIGLLTASHERWRLAGRLQAAGVPASVVETAGDVFIDPMLAARRYWRTLDHPVMGPVRAASAPHMWNGAPVPPTAPAPLLGQHTEEISRDLLQISAGEYEHLVADEVLW